MSRSTSVREWGLNSTKALILMVLTVLVVSSIIIMVPTSSEALDTNVLTNDFAPEVEFPQASKASVLNDGVDYIILSCKVTDDDNKTSEGSNFTVAPGFVAVDLSPIGLSSNHTLLDDGFNGDIALYDDFYSTNITVPPTTLPGVYHLPIMAWDNGSAPDQKNNLTENITLTVAQYNRAPVLRASPPTSLDLEEDNGSAFILTNETVFYDADVENGTESLTYTFHNGTAWVSSWDSDLALVLFNALGNLSVFPKTNASGQLDITLNATDEQTQWVVHLFTINIASVNDLPVLNITDDDLELTAWEDEWLNKTFGGYDPADMTAVTVTATLLGPGTTVPAGFTMTPLGNLSFLPTNDDVGDWWFNISVSDGELSVYENVTITVQNTNDAPSVITIDGETPVDGEVELTATEDEYYNFSLMASDDDIIHGEELIFSSVFFGDNFVINSTNGNVSFLPTNDDVGTVSGAIVVSDGPGGETDSVNVTITVSNVNDPPLTPIIQWPLNDTEFINLSTSFTVWPLPVITDDDGDELNYSWDMDDGSTRYGFNISYEYAVAGTYNVTLTVDDGNGGTSMAKVTVVVEDPGGGAVVTDLLSYEDCQQTYDDVLDDVVTYTKDGASILAQKGGNDPGDIDGLSCGKDGANLLVNLTLKGTVSEDLSYVIYFVNNNHSEDGIPEQSPTLPTDYVPDVATTLYTASSHSSIRYSYGTPGGLGTVVVDSNVLRFTVPISDLVEKGGLQPGFGLFAKAVSSNSTSIAYDSCGLGAKDAPDVTDYISSGGGDDDDSMFGLGKVGPVDIFYIMVGVGVLLVIIIIIVVVISMVTGKKDTTTDDSELAPQDYTPADESYYTADTTNEVITDDMYEDTFGTGQQAQAEVPDVPAMPEIPPVPLEQPAQQTPPPAPVAPPPAEAPPQVETPPMPEMAPVEQPPELEPTPMEQPVEPAPAEPAPKGPAPELQPMEPVE